MSCRNCRAWRFCSCWCLKYSAVTMVANSIAWVCLCPSTPHPPGRFALGYALLIEKDHLRYYRPPLERVLKVGGEPQLDFIQLRSIAERFSEALQQCAWDFNQLRLLV